MCDVEPLWYDVSGSFILFGVSLQVVGALLVEWVYLSSFLVAAATHCCLLPIVVTWCGVVLRHWLVFCRHGVAVDWVNWSAHGRSKWAGLTYIG